MEQTIASNFCGSHVAPYLRQLADALALRDWSFALLEEAAADGFAAQIQPLRGRKRAEIRLGADFLSLSPDRQRHCLTHELLHCHFAQCGFVAEETLTPSLQSCLVLSLEYGVDGLADCLAPLLPLPTNLFHDE